MSDTNSWRNTDCQRVNWWNLSHILRKPDAWLLFPPGNLWANPSHTSRKYLLCKQVLHYQLSILLGLPHNRHNAQQTKTLPHSSSSSFSRASSILNLLYREIAFRTDKIANAKMCSFVLTCLQSSFLSIADIIYIKLWRNPSKPIVKGFAFPLLSSNHLMIFLARRETLHLLFRLGISLANRERLLTLENSLKLSWLSWDFSIENSKTCLNIRAHALFFLYVKVQNVLCWSICQFLDWVPVLTTPRQ